MSNELVCMYTMYTMYVCKLLQVLIDNEIIDYIFKEIETDIRGNSKSGRGGGRSLMSFLKIEKKMS